jgi:hypothetical protein
VPPESQPTQPYPHHNAPVELVVPMQVYIDPELPMPQSVADLDCDSNAKKHIKCYVQAEIINQAAQCLSALAPSISS